MRGTHTLILISEACHSHRESRHFTTLRMDISRNAIILAQQSLIKRSCVSSLSKSPYLAVVSCAAGDPLINGTDPLGSIIGVRSRSCYCIELKRHCLRSRRGNSTTNEWKQIASKTREPAWSKRSRYVFSDNLPCSRSRASINRNRPRINVQFPPPRTNPDFPPPKQTLTNTQNHTFSKNFYSK